MGHLNESIFDQKPRIKGGAPEKIFICVIIFGDPHAEMGDVTTLNAIAEEIKDQSDSCIPLSKQIIQMAEDFDLDGIQKLADDLDAC